jgi:hypothetical protein
MPDAAPSASTLRILWLGICGGALALMAVMGWLATTSGDAPLAESRDLVFYGVALVAVAATAGAFALFRAMEGRLLQAGSDAEAAGLIRSFGIPALATAELPAILGAVGAFLTGELLTLAFGATLFAFAWLTWPSDDRLGYWLSLRQRR